MTNQNHTADTLAALPDAELVRIAERLRGYAISMAVHSPITHCCTDANQALTLLSYAVKQGADFMIRLGGSRPRIVIFGETLTTIPDTVDARAMTIAFILAMQEVGND